MGCEEALRCRASSFFLRIVAEFQLGGSKWFRWFTNLRHPLRRGARIPAENATVLGAALRQHHTI